MRGQTEGSASRRTILKTVAAIGSAGVVGTAATGVGAAFSGDDGDITGGDDFPRVTTRGHFDIHWWYGDQLTDGHTADDYEMAGQLPHGVDEVVIATHGWLVAPSEAPDHFATVETALSQNGYDTPVVGFSYDSDTGITDWWPATDIAERNGPKLAQFLVDYAGSNPSTTIRTTAHSLGARVVLEAAKTLDRWGKTDILDSITLLGGAADNDGVSLGGEYGDALAAAVGQVDNFWKDDDDVLQWAYATGEFDAAVGEEGCDGSPPGNYTDHNVNYVPDHFSYHEPGDGCIPEVVASW